MNADIIREQGVCVKRNKDSGSEIWQYNGLYWCIFISNKRFAYCWGKTI